MMDREEVHIERRAFRAGRVRLAFATSAASKALGLLVQFLAVPLAVRSLGAERFGIYTMLVSALVWIDLGRLGIGPGLTRQLALAWNQGQRRREQILFSNAVYLLLLMAMLIAAALIAGYHMGSSYVGTVFGPSATRYQPEIVAGIIIIGAFLVFQVVFSAGESARSAYQDDFINNLMNMLANIISLILIVAVALFWPSIPAFAMAVFGSIVLAKGVNFLLLVFRSRPYLFPHWRYVARAEMRPLLGASLAFWAIQIGTLMMHNISLVQLGQMVGAEELTPFAVIFRLLQLLSTGVLMISMPLWPAITDAAVRGDDDWIKRAYHKLVMSATAFSIMVAIGMSCFGSISILYWAGDDALPSQALNVSLGIYFIIWMWNHCHSAILFGLGKLWVVAYTALAEGALVLVLAAWLVPQYGPVGTAIALSIAGAATTGWILPFLLRRTLRHSRRKKAGLSSPVKVQMALPKDSTL